MAGLIKLPTNLLGGLASVAAGHLARRWTMRRLVVMSVAVSLAAWILLAFRHDSLAVIVFAFSAHSRNSFSASPRAAERRDCAELKELSTAFASLNGAKIVRTVRLFRKTKPIGKGSASDKIDGVSALVTAMNRAMHHQSAGRSAYEDDDLEIV